MSVLETRSCVEVSGTTPPLLIGPDRLLSAEDVAALARSMATRVGFSSESYTAMKVSEQALHRCRDRGDAIYGITTGFGPLVRFDASASSTTQGSGLTSHLAAGWGDAAPVEVVRATMLVRAQGVAQGYSGVSRGAAEGLVELLNRGVTPSVPCIGSVGASGDLVPLAHVAKVLEGQGDVVTARGVESARDVLTSVGMSPMRLEARDALGIVNGTAFMTAYAALALADADRMLRRTEQLTGWMYDLLGARTQALDSRLHAARGHPGQAQSAASILDAMTINEEDETRHLQEVYSVRCAPQFLGACRDQLAAARTIIEREVNGVSDNPVVISGDDPAVLHGGNFQGQQISFAADMVNAAMTHIAVLVERQLDVLLNPEFNGGAPMLLAWEPGATSGLAGLQITATALTAEMKLAATPAAFSSMPTNGRNQDVVSMGTMAARHAYEQGERLSGVLASLAIGLSQLGFLRGKGRAEGRVVDPPAWLPAIEGVQEDRPLRGDLQRVAQRIRAA